MRRRCERHQGGACAATDGSSSLDCERDRDHQGQELLLSTSGRSEDRLATFIHVFTVTEPPTATQRHHDAAVPASDGHAERHVPILFSAHDIQLSAAVRIIPPAITARPVETAHGHDERGAARCIKRLSDAFARGCPTPQRAEQRVVDIPSVQLRRLLPVYRMRGAPL